MEADGYPGSTEFERRIIAAGAAESEVKEKWNRQKRRPLGRLAAKALRLGGLTPAERLIQTQEKLSKSTSERLQENHEFFATKAPQAIVGPSAKLTGLQDDLFKVVSSPDNNLRFNYPVYDPKSFESRTYDMRMTQTDDGPIMVEFFDRSGKHPNDPINAVEFSDEVVNGFKSKEDKALVLMVPGAIADAAYQSEL